MCVSYGVQIGWPLVLIRAFNTTVVTQSHANAKKTKMGQSKDPLLWCHTSFYSKDASIFGLIFG